MGDLFCGGKTGHGNVVKHGMLNQVLLDYSAKRKVKKEKFERQRLRCKDCGKTFLKSSNKIDDSHQMTKRLANRIAGEALSQSFTFVAKKFGVSESTVRNIFADRLVALETAHRFEAPAILGLDTVQLIRDSLLLTNLVEGTVIEILPSVEPCTLSPYLESLQEHPPHAVCMGMWPFLFETFQNAFPGTRIVVPWRHLVSKADLHLEEVRKAARSTAKRYDHKKLECDRLILGKPRGSLSAWEQQFLDGWHERFPLLAQAYEVREDLADIADSTTALEAAERCSIWASGLSPTLQNVFAEVLHAISDWREPLLAAFDLDIPNPARWNLPAQVEEVHRVGRGYSFDALRARLLFTSETHKVIQNDGRIRNLGVDAEAVQRKMTRYKPGRRTRTLRRSRHS